MKRFIIFSVVIIVIYSIYNDLTVGTVPVSDVSIQTNYINTVHDDKPFFQVTITPGDTVISVMEEYLQSQIPVSIDQLIKDFEELNEGTKPEQIQVGKSYKFPIYQENL